MPGKVYDVGKWPKKTKGFTGTPRPMCLHFCRYWIASPTMSAMSVTPTKANLDNNDS